jgi:hypothetical protein
MNLCLYFLFESLDYNSQEVQTKYHHCKVCRKQTAKAEANKVSQRRDIVEDSKR